MRKHFLGALIASAFAMAAPAHAGLVLNLDGAGTVISADALDWGPTSFLAQGGNAAIAAFVGSGGTCPSGCSFDVLTHSKLTGYKPTGSSGFTGLPAGFTGEITMVARYTETVTSFSTVGSPSAQFVSTGAGWVEFYYSSSADSNDLTGANYNNGRLIGRLDGTTIGALGLFTTFGTPVALDGTGDGDQYPGQLTARGTGSQSNLEAGTTGVSLDPTFFLTTLTGFSLEYENISIGLPYLSANPSDCFTPTASGAAVGTNGLASTCDNAHQLGPYSAQVNATGYTPLVGAINGFDLRSPDFVAQTDFNSAVSGVPTPGGLALAGLALAGLGLVSRRRRV